MSPRAGTHVREGKVTMKIYHGSPTSGIREFRILPPPKGLDLGPGVYLTTHFEQAKQRALREKGRKGSVYEFDIDYSSLISRVFTKEDDDLLDVICLCRTDLILVANEVIDGFEDADVIVSPMLDGSVPGFRRIAERFIDGEISFETFSKHVKLFENDKDQLCFKSEKAVRFLNKRFMQEHVVFRSEEGEI